MSVLSNASTDSLYLPGHAGGIQLDASSYYGQQQQNSKDRHKLRGRTYSSTAAGGAAVRKPATMGDDRVELRRRLSHGASPITT
jgi:hypothetical protein